MRRRLSFISLCVGGAALVACAATEPPPRSPLAEPPTTLTSTAGTVTSMATSVASPTATFPGGLPTPAEAEPAAARALALLAEWIAIPARTLRVMVAEAIVWPDACLGIEQPGMVCAQVLTPGFRVLLQDPLGGAHTVHTASASGDARWAGEVRVQGEITALDMTAGRVTLRLADGSALMLRLMSGTSWLPAASQAAIVGGRVVAAYDPAGGSATPMAAWIALDPS